VSEIVLPHNWEPREYQLPTYRYMRGPAPRKRAVFVCHRRGGKDLMSVSIIATAAMERVGAYWHMYPEFKQARSAIWNGITSEGEPGNEGARGTKFLDHIPGSLVERAYANEMRIKFINGSNYYLVGSDNYDGLMGTNPVGIVFSEWSLMNPACWHYLAPILEENGGWALFIFTFRGKNHGWHLAQQAKINGGWFYDERDITVTKKPNGEPVITEAQVQKLRDEGMPEAVIQSEFYNNPDIPLEGAYYAKEMERVKKSGRIGNVPYDARFPVYTAWDIGHDMTVIVFVQLIHQEIRVIDCIYKSEEGLPHYVARVKEKPYDVYEKHFAPWDMDTREWASGKSRMQIAKDLGIQFSVKPQKPGNEGVKDGIEQTRIMLNRCIFDATKCKMLIEGLRSYRAEPDQDKMQFTGDQGEPVKVFKDTPMHDWSSHFADSVRVLAWNIAQMKKQNTAPQEKAEDNYQYT
jgi:hypothetical protein